MEHFIHEGTPIEDAYRWVRENNIASRNARGELSTPGANRPLLTRGGDLPNEQRTIGARIVAHPDFQLLQRGGRKVVSMEFPDVANFRAA